MIIRINQKNCIQLDNVLYTSIEFMKTKGGPEVPVHTVFLVGGKNLVVSYQDAIQILFPENNAHLTQQPAQVQNPTAPTYAEEINAPEEYVVLKTFNAANDPSLRIELGTVLKKTKIEGLTKWTSDKNAKIIFDYQALQNREFFGLPGSLLEPSVSVNEIPTPKIEKKPE